MCTLLWTRYETCRVLSLDREMNSLRLYKKSLRVWNITLTPLDGGLMFFYGKDLFGYLLLRCETTNKLHVFISPFSLSLSSGEEMDERWKDNFHPVNQKSIYRFKIIIQRYTGCICFSIVTENVDIGAAALNYQYFVYRYVCKYICT